MPFPILVKTKSSEERRNSSTSDNSTFKITPTRKEKKSPGKRKEGGKGSKGDNGPPPESMQPPPGPLVALGRPKDKAVKRPRSVEGTCTSRDCAFMSHDSH